VVVIVLFLSLSTTYLTEPAKYIASSWPSHLFQLPAFSTGRVKLQFAEHTLAESGACVVAFQLLGDGNVVVAMALLSVNALAVFVTEREVAEACGCAGSFAVIDTVVMLVDAFIGISHDKPATTSDTPNSIARSNHIAFISAQHQTVKWRSSNKCAGESFTYYCSQRARYGHLQHTIRLRQHLCILASVLRAVGAEYRSSLASKWATVRPRSLAGTSYVRCRLWRIRGFGRRKYTQSG
jgi:hypothetical protein